LALSAKNKNKVVILINYVGYVKPSVVGEFKTKVYWISGKMD
jgi:hypothetical protein